MMIVDFIAVGTPRVVSRAIEEYARAQGRVSAIVVPWESDATTLSMSVTSVRSDGWAVEHTNLGTITLTNLGNESTAVRVVAQANPDAPVPKPVSDMFDRFAHQLQSRFQAAS